MRGARAEGLVTFCCYLTTLSLHMFLKCVGNVSLYEGKVLGACPSNGQEHQQQLLVVTRFDGHVIEG